MVRVSAKWASQGEKWALQGEAPARGPTPFVYPLLTNGIPFTYLV